MHHGASFKDYAGSYDSIQGKKASAVIPASGLKEEKIDLRQPSPDTGPVEKQKNSKTQHRQIGDIMRKVNGFQFITSTCGLKLKIPPNYKGQKVMCPKCREVINLKQ